MKITWASEACDRAFDPESGARLSQLTSSAATSTNVYCEQPYTSPDGRRVVILRRNDISFDPSWRLIVADLDRLKLTLIEPDGVVGTFNAAWSGQLIYVMEGGEVIRLDLQTLEKRRLDAVDGRRLRGRAGSVSPDQRYLICAQTEEGPRPTPAIARVDLRDGSTRVIFRHPEMTNPHIQFNPVHGRDIVLQMNRGSGLDRHGNRVSAPLDRHGFEASITHMLIGADGGNLRELPFGPPWTASSTGHSNFVADTGAVAFMAQWDHASSRHDPRHPRGNTFTARPGDAAPTLFAAPEFRFNHISVSRCGTYFVGDSHDGAMYGPDGRLRSACLVVGNFETGKYRKLVSDTRCKSGGGQHSHTHAYFTADNRHVIYNTNFGHSPTQVVAAHVPDDFLPSLA